MGSNLQGELYASHTPCPQQTSISNHSISPRSFLGEGGDLGARPCREEMPNDGMGWAGWAYESGASENKSQCEFAKSLDKEHIRYGLS